MKLNKNRNTEIVDDVIVPEMNESHKIEETFIGGFEEEIKDEPDESTFEPKTGIVVNCNSLYVRSAAHSNASPIDVINGGTTIKIIGEDGDFWQLEKPEGFSMKKFIKVV